MFKIFDGLKISPGDHGIAKVPERRRAKTRAKANSEIL